ncbi:MAG: hypothetical protein WB810_02360 [Candidatus Cybelea sp.]
MRLMLATAFENTPQPIAAPSAATIFHVPWSFVLAAKVSQCGDTLRQRVRAYRGALEAP